MASWENLELNGYGKGKKIIECDILQQAMSDHQRVFQALNTDEDGHLYIVVLSDRKFGFQFRW